MSATPTPEQRQRAEWDLLLADLEYRRNQSRWEMPKAVAMIVLAAAAIFAAGGVSGWLLPTHTQEIIVHFDQPLAVKVQP
jgi:hypothetical protein